MSHVSSINAIDVTTVTRECWLSIGPLVQWSIGPFVHLSMFQFVHLLIGPLVYWSISPLVNWSQLLLKRTSMITVHFRSTTDREIWKWNAYCYHVLYLYSFCKCVSSLVNDWCCRKAAEDEATQLAEEEDQEQWRRSRQGHSGEAQKQREIWKKAREKEKKIAAQEKFESPRTKLKQYDTHQR